MKTIAEFYMNKDTILFCPRYDDLGNMYTCILENENLFKSHLPPTDLMEESLKYYGSSLAGAKAGASMILGDTFMSPVAVSERLGLYWFPSKSPSRRDCVWFALHQINKYTAIEKKKTKVTFNNGSSYVVGISCYSFENRMKDAYKLKAENEMKMWETPKRIAESRTVYHFNESDRGSNYSSELSD